MIDIVFTAPFGNDRKTIRISRPFGGSTNYSIHIDNYFQGEIFPSGDSWDGYLNSRSELQWVDIQLLGERISRSMNDSK